MVSDGVAGGSAAPFYFKNKPIDNQLLTKSLKYFFGSNVHGIG